MWGDFYRSPINPSTCYCTLKIELKSSNLMSFRKPIWYLSTALEVSVGNG